MADLISMDELLQPATPDPQSPWPHSPPEEGKVYAFTCPNTGARMVAMTQDTFLNYGTMIEGLRRVSASLDARCKELHAAQAGLVAQHNDLQQRHEALRQHLRSDRLAALEKQVVVPDRKDTRKFTRR